MARTTLLMLALFALMPTVAESQSLRDRPQMPQVATESRLRFLPGVETPNTVGQLSAPPVRPIPAPLPPNGNPSDVGPFPASPESIPPGAQAPPLARLMTLSDLEGIAVGNNPTLAQASARVQAARSNWVQVGLYPNPTVGYQAVEIGNEGRAGQQGIIAGQEFVRGHKLQLDRNAAAQAVRQAEQEFEAQRMRVVNDVRTGYYDALIAQRRVELADQLVQTGQQGFRATEQLFKGQEGTRIDLMQSRIELSSAQIVAANSRNNYQAVWRRLAATLGVPGMTPVSLGGDFEAGLCNLTWENSLQNLLENSPELAAARAGVQQARWALSRARAEPIPNIDVQFTAQHDNATTDNIVGVQAVLPIPVFNRNQGGIGRAEAELNVASREVQRVQLELQQRLAVAFEQYANAKQQVDRYSNEILPDARTSFDLVSTLYRRGESGYLMLLTAQRTYFQANLAYLDSLQELRQSSIAINGLLLTDSLNIGSIPTRTAHDSTGSSPLLPGITR